MYFLGEKNFFSYSWTLPANVLLSIVLCVTCHDKKFFLFPFLSFFFLDIDQWDHLCKNVSRAKVKSSGRISETGVGFLTLMKCGSMAVKGMNGAWGTVQLG